MDFCCNDFIGFCFCEDFAFSLVAAVRWTRRVLAAEIFACIVCCVFALALLKESFALFEIYFFIFYNSRQVPRRCHEEAAESDFTAPLACMNKLTRPQA